MDGPLTPKAADILLLLLREAGRVVTKEQLLEQVWPGVVVEEGVIASNVSVLRKVLDDDFAGDGPIATVQRRGYRFTAEVRRAGDSAELAANGASPARPAALPARETVLVADIENKTGDPVFDGTIKQALLLHLAQSPFLEVISDRKVHALLGYMGKSGTPVLGEVALEICQRTGTKAAITGSVFVIGDVYVIGLQALHGETGDILLAEQARAHGKGEVLKALDQAAIGLRTKLGESLASVNTYFRHFDEVATSSLEALRAYTAGRREWLEHGEAAAKPHQLRAIELDPGFVSAWSALAIACANMGQTVEARAYMQKAYELRERSSDRERARTLANYHEMVTGDIYKGIDAQRALAASVYADGISYGNLGNLYATAGQWDRALAEGARGKEMEYSAIVASNVTIAQLALGMYEAARATLEEAFERGYDAFYLHLDAYQEAFLRRDRAAMQRHVDAVAGRAGEEDFIIGPEADTEAYFGRFTRARELSRRAADSARSADAPEMSATWTAEAALREALIGNDNAARTGATAAMDIDVRRYIWGLAGVALALAGDADRARRAADALAEHDPQHTIVQRNWLPCIRAALALRAKDWKAAADALEPAKAVELGLTAPFEGGFMIPPYLRGLALLGAGRGADAAMEFQKIIDRPGLVKNFVVFPLAHLQASRALALARRPDEAAPMKSRFEEIWKEADVATPPGWS